MGGGEGIKTNSKGDEGQEMVSVSLEPDNRYPECCSHVFRPGKVVRDCVVGLLVVLGIAVVITVLFVVCYYVLNNLEFKERPDPILGNAKLDGDETETEIDINVLEVNVAGSVPADKYDVQLEKIKKGDEHHHGHGDHHHAQPEPESEPEAEPESEPEAEPESEPEAEPESEPEAEPEPTSEGTVFVAPSEIPAVHVSSTVEATPSHPELAHTIAPEPTAPVDVAEVATAAPSFPSVESPVGQFAGDDSAIRVVPGPVLSHPPSTHSPHLPHHDEDHDQLSTGDRTFLFVESSQPTGPQFETVMPTGAKVEEDEHSHHMTSGPGLGASWPNDHRGEVHHVHQDTPLPESGLTPNSAVIEEGDQDSSLSPLLDTFSPSGSGSFDIAAGIQSSGGPEFSSPVVTEVETIETPVVVDFTSPVLSPTATQSVVAERILPTVVTPEDFPTVTFEEEATPTVVSVVENIQDDIVTLSDKISHIFPTEIIPTNNEEIQANVEEINFPETAAPIDIEKTESPIAAIIEEFNPLATPGQNDRQVSCHKRQLEMCEGILPYEETAFPNLVNDMSASELNISKPYFEDIIVRSGCSPRSLAFSCAILEPPCVVNRDGTPAILPPCRTFCRAVESTCREFILPGLVLSAAFNCDQFPDSADPAVCVNLAGALPDLTTAQDIGTTFEEFATVTPSTIPVETFPPTTPSAQETEEPFHCPELQCSDGKCIVLGQINDGVQDCSDGSDEVSFAKFF